MQITRIISSIFKTRSGEADLSWTPLSKRFNMPSGLIVDVEMVTAGGFNSDHKPLGVARYCFVAYNPPKQILPTRPGSRGSVPATPVFTVIQGDEQR